VQSREALVDAVSGTQGGIIALFAALPLEVVQKNQAKLSGKEAQVMAIVRKVMAEKGTAGFWSGASVLTLLVGIEKFLYFLLFAAMRSLAEGDAVGSAGAASLLGMGYLADLGCRPIIMPLEVIAMRMALVNTSPTGAAQQIASESGAAGFYKGASFYLALAFKPAVQQAVFDRVKATYLAQKGLAPTTALSFGEAFLLGAVGRVIATLLTYPFFRAKQLSQAGAGAGDGASGAAKGGKKKKQRRGGILAQVGAIFEQSGVGGLYQGCPAEMARGVLFQGVLMSCKERLTAMNQGWLLEPASDLPRKQA
jgi:adenine nucleotide transporter 17